MNTDEDYFDDDFDQEDLEEFELEMMRRKLIEELRPSFEN